MLKYMSIIKEWPGYGSTLFDVEVRNAKFRNFVNTKKVTFALLLWSLQCKEGGFPHDLWLSVSADNVSVYKRGEPKPLETFQYEHITFFGAASLCTYKIIVDEREMFFETPLVRTHSSHFFFVIFYLIISFTHFELQFRSVLSFSPLINMLMTKDV